MKKIIGLWMVILLSLSAAGQKTQFCTGELDEAHRKLYNNALQIRHSDKNKALDMLNKVLNYEPDCGAAAYYMGEINYQVGMRSLSEVTPEHIQNNGYLSRAKDFFEQTISICPSFEDYQVYYYLGMYHYDSKHFEKAGKYLKQFIENSSSDYETLKQARKCLKKVNHYMQLINNPVDYQPEKLANINTSSDEYLPVLSPDGNFLFFTRTGVRETGRGKRTETYEKFMVSRYYRTDTGGFFGEPEPMPYPFNQASNQGGGCITINNRTFYITVCSRVHTSITSYKNCDIFVSYFKNNSWSKLQNLGSAINSKTSWEAQPTISSDGETLYFASAREDGYGGIDIYRTRKDSNGIWSEAENLGPVINTSGDDKTPFLHTDDKTLYFSSNGHFGLGGFDMFVSRLQKDGSWSKPKNLGYPLNTANNEIAYVISTNGKRMYFASKDIGSNDNWDIYKAKVPEKARPDSVLLLTGFVFNENGEPVSNATVEMHNITTLKIIEGLVGKKSGDFAIATSVDKNDEFIVTARKEGFFFSSQYIKPNKNNVNEPEEMDFVMKKVKVGTRIRLRNIYFDTNSARFDKVSRVTLQNLLRFMRLNPTIHISIHGHTDSIGTRADNLKLSQRRARAVHDYLINNGIDSTRLSYKGFGESRPIATNFTRKGRAQNRRTEFVVTVR